MIKRFFEWIRLKEKLHTIQKGPPLVSERDLWWILDEEDFKRVKTRFQELYK